MKGCKSGYAKGGRARPKCMKDGGAVLYDPDARYYQSEVDAMRARGASGPGTTTSRAGTVNEGGTPRPRNQQKGTTPGMKDGGAVKAGASSGVHRLQMFKKGKG